MAGLESWKGCTMIQDHERVGDTEPCPPPPEAVSDTIPCPPPWEIGDWEVQDDDVCCECPTEEIDRWAITRALGKLDEPFEELGIIDIIIEEI